MEDICSLGVLEIPDEWVLHHGGRISGARIAWRLSGPANAPIVCAMGGIWCDRRLFDPEDPRAGCWREVVGPGRPLDSRRFRILSFDYLGGSGDSTGPQPGEKFPSISTYDQAEALARVLASLQIRSLRAIVGGSYGGMVALAFAERYPEQTAELFIVSAADRPHAMAVAWHSVQRQIVRFAIECGRPQEGLRLARAVALSLYRSSEEFAARFPVLPVAVKEQFVFPVERYLFPETADLDGGLRAESFLCLSESLDLHQMDATRVFVPTMAVAAREDQLVPIADVRALVARMGSAQLREISSIHGHDAYLREPEQLRGMLASALAATG
ncbi:MAG TPA: alpha/beta fold hydrolase [Steroidobacteraceae bacterium]|nr:alpha/beta fold hydrolase [Steroidobacteraceae bacterium]